MPSYAYARTEVISLDGHIAVELYPGTFFVFEALATESPDMLGNKEIGIAGNDMVIMHRGSQHIFKNGKMINNSK